MDGANTLGTTRLYTQQVQLAGCRPQTITKTTELVSGHANTHSMLQSYIREDLLTMYTHTHTYTVSYIYTYHNAKLMICNKICKRDLLYELSLVGYPFKCHYNSSINFNRASIAFLANNVAGTYFNSIAILIKRLFLPVSLYNIGYMYIILWYSESPLCTALIGIIYYTMDHEYH